MKQPNDLILIGFGKQNLSDLLAWIGDPEKEEELIKAPFKWPPHYRRIGICSQEEIRDCKIYVDWLFSVLNRLDNKEK